MHEYVHSLYGGSLLGEISPKENFTFKGYGSNVILGKDGKLYYEELIGWPDISIIPAAYTKARQARFEHGEKG